MEPNKDRIRILVAVLRSGIYPQGTGWLCRLNEDNAITGMCCLGVGAEIAVKLGGLSIDVQDDHASEDEDDLSARSYDGEMVYWPAPVADWYGIRNKDPQLILPDAILGRVRDKRISGMSATAARLNDAGISFADIADAFECTFLPEEYNARHPGRGDDAVTAPDSRA